MTTKNNKKKVKLKIDRTKCLQCGTCALMFDKYFQIKENGEIDDSGATVNENEVKNIIDCCPVEAIGT